jgi:hypothetical protein
MPQDPPLPDAQCVAEAIRRYLSEHPQAADTAPGIQRWWLLPQFGEVCLQTVEDALTLLEQAGAISKLEQPWAPTTWARPGPASAPH